MILEAIHRSIYNFQSINSGKKPDLIVLSPDLYALLEFEVYSVFENRAKYFYEKNPDVDLFMGIKLIRSKNIDGFYLAIEQVIT